MIVPRGRHGPGGWREGARHEGLSRARTATPPCTRRSGCPPRGLVPRSHRPTPPYARRSGCPPRRLVPRLRPPIPRSARRAECPSRPLVPRSRGQHPWLRRLSRHWDSRGIARASAGASSSRFFLLLDAMGILHFQPSPAQAEETVAEAWSQAAAARCPVAVLLDLEFWRQ